MPPPINIDFIDFIIILSLVIKASQDFIRHSEEDIKDNAPVLNSFYEAISNVYIPLLEMIEKLEADNVKYRFALVLPPVLCNMLSDSVLQDEYLKWLDKRNDLGKAELRRNKENPYLEWQNKNGTKAGFL